MIGKTSGKMMGLVYGMIVYRIGAGGNGGQKRDGNTEFTEIGTQRAQR
jgi:hypothetical protein